MSDIGPVKQALEACVTQFFKRSSYPTERKSWYVRLSKTLRSDYTSAQYDQCIGWALYRYQSFFRQKTNTDQTADLNLYFVLL